MAIGLTQPTTDGSGVHEARMLTRIGHLIVMAVGFGVLLTVGRGSVTSRGGGLHTTTVVGSTTTIPGRGVHEAVTTAIEVGGGLR